MDDDSRSGHAFSFLRHLTTLSAGAIALQIGFLEKVFPHPQWKGLFAASIILFTASVVFSIISQWFLLGLMNVGITETRKTLGGLAIISMWLCFIFGLLTAVVFSLKNLSTL